MLRCHGSEQPGAYLRRRLCVIVRIVVISVVGAIICGRGFVFGLAIVIESSASVFRAFSLLVRRLETDGGKIVSPA
jgi:hypothetical protein